MKSLIILAHVTLGVILILYGGAGLLGTGLQFFDPLTGGVVLGASIIRALTITFVILLGVLFIWSASAFKNDKRWAQLTLPLLPLIPSLLIFYELYSSPPSDFAYTGGIIGMIAVLLLLFSFGEMLFVYVKYLRKPAQVVLPPLR